MTPSAYIYYHELGLLVNVNVLTVLSVQLLQLLSLEDTREIVSLSKFKYKNININKIKWPQNAAPFKTTLRKISEDKDQF